MTCSAICSMMLGQTGPVPGILAGPTASEVGLLLLIGAGCFMAGFGLRWFWRCVKTLFFVLLVVALALWLAGVGLRPTVAAPTGLMPSVHGACEMVQTLLAAPLRGGIGAVGFVLGLASSRRGGRRQDAE